MRIRHNPLDRRSEELLARLTCAAYAVALESGLQAPFVDVQLGIWKALRSVLHEHDQASDEASRETRIDYDPLMFACS